MNTFQGDKVTIKEGREANRMELRHGRPPRSRIEPSHSSSSSEPDCCLSSGSDSSCGEVSSSSEASEMRRFLCLFALLRFWPRSLRGFLFLDDEWPARASALAAVDIRAHLHVPASNALINASYSEFEKLLIGPMGRSRGQPTISRPFSRRYAR